MNCETCGYVAKNERGLKIHMSKHKQEPTSATASDETRAEEAKPVEDPKPSNDPILQRLEELERKNQELEKRAVDDQKTLKMLYEVADKGRVFNWESKQNKPGQGQRIKVSVLEGKYVIGWRTVRDELITDPRTGSTVGELQQYEIQLLEKDGSSSFRTLNGYKAFSDLRYDQRVDCQVLSRSESYDGTLKFRVGLPDGREYELDSRFIN